MALTDEKRAPVVKRVIGGSKPKLIRLAKLVIIENKIGEAELAFAVMVATMHGALQPTWMQARAAQWVWETVMGKPLQRTANDMSEETKKMIAKYYESLGIKSSHLS